MTKCILFFVMLFSWSGLSCQVKVSSFEYHFNYVNYQECQAYATDISIPVFFNSQQKPLAYINDSLMADTTGITTGMYMEPPDSIVDDTTGEYLCSEMDLLPEYNSLSYSIRQNKKNFLSFEITNAN